MVKKNSKKPPAQKPEKPRTLGWQHTITGRAFLIFFVGACMFTLGVFVGRGTAPVRFDIQELQEELAALREAVKKKELHRAKIYRQAISQKEEFGFYEALKRPDEEIAGEEDLEVSGAKPVETAAAANREKTAAKSAPAAGPGASKQRAPSRGSFVIQVSSVKDVKAAETLVAQLKQKGYDAEKVMGKVPGKGIWYRVRIGDFKTRADARNALERMKKDGLGGFVLHR